MSNTLDLFAPDISDNNDVSSFQVVNPGMILDGGNNYYLATFILDDGPGDTSGNINIYEKSASDASGVSWGDATGSPINISGLGDFNSSILSLAVTSTNKKYLAFGISDLNGNVSGGSIDASGVGLVRIYTESGSGWSDTPETTIYPTLSDFGLATDGSANYLNFGSSIDMKIDSNDNVYVIVSAPGWYAIRDEFDFLSAQFYGAVAVYKQTNATGTFSLLGSKIHNGTDDNYSEFGKNVSLAIDPNDNIYACLSSQYDNNDNGRLRVYKYVDPSWNLQGEILGNSDTEVNVGSNIIATNNDEVFVGYNSQNGFNRVVKYASFDPSYNDISPTDPSGITFDASGGILTSNQNRYIPLAYANYGTNKTLLTIINDASDNDQIFTTNWTSNISDSSANWVQQNPSGLEDLSGTQINFAQEGKNPSIILNPSNTNVVFATFIRSDFGNPTGTRTYEYTNTTLLCFKKGTKILTDQGEINIENLSQKNTINHNKIHSVPKSIFGGKKIIKIKKDAFGTNKPYVDTIITPEHRVYENEEVTHTTRILDLVNNETILEIDANHDTIYSVVLDNKHDYMYANGLKVETTPFKHVPHFKLK